jgi:hypothetical protein
MRALAILTVLSFIATPALAQNAEPQQPGDPGNAVPIQQQVRNNLQQAGFTDIQIMPSSFLVRAKDRAGNSVMMVINPDSVTTVTEIGGPGGVPASVPSTADGAAANAPSGSNSGAGIAGQPGSKSGPAVKSPNSTTGSGASSDAQRSQGSGNQDAAKVPGLPGSKSGPAVKPPSARD